MYTKTGVSPQKYFFFCSAKELKKNFVQQMNLAVPPTEMSGAHRSFFYAVTNGPRVQIVIPKVIDYSDAASK